jgi:hypothetical protein
MGAEPRTTPATGPTRHHLPTFLASRTRPPARLSTPRQSSRPYLSWWMTRAVRSGDRLGPGVAFIPLPLGGFGGLAARPRQTTRPLIEICDVIAV